MDSSYGSGSMAVKKKKNNEKTKDEKKLAENNKNR